MTEWVAIGVSVAIAVYAAVKASAKESGVNEQWRTAVDQDRTRFSEHIDDDDAHLTIHERSAREQTLAAMHEDIKGIRRELSDLRIRMYGDSK